VDPSRPPSCQEDPYHEHQYPGCPHMGGCQRGGQCTPPPATPKVKHHKKKKKKAHPVSVSRANKKQTGKDPENSGVSGVDTMECRPSDVHLDEMDTSKPD